jgi:hypothetical protein
MKVRGPINKTSALADLMRAGRRIPPAPAASAPRFQHAPDNLRVIVRLADFSQFLDDQPAGERDAVARQHVLVIRLVFG